MRASHFFLHDKNWFLLLFLFLNLNCVNLGNPQGLGPTGIIYSHYKIGFSENLIPEKDSKSGKACTKRIFFFYTSGDSSISAAAKSGNITDVKSVNKEAYNLLLLYSSLCTIVTGV